MSEKAEDVKKSVMDSVKQEAAEQASHAIASEVGKSLRKFLEQSLSPDTIRKLSGSGLVKIMSNVVAFVIRLAIPDTKKGELIKDAVTEAINEAFDFQDSPEGAGAPVAERTAVAASSVGRAPSPRKGNQAVLLATDRALKKLVKFISSIYETFDEQEAENVLAWLNSLSQVELEGFALLGLTDMFDFWKAQKDPKEKKRLAEIAAQERVKFVAWYRDFDARAKARADLFHGQIEAVKLQREIGLPWLERLKFWKM